MIKVTKLNGRRLWVNAEMIRFIESTHDTVISLVRGEKVVVKESPDEVAEAIIAYKQRVYSPLEQGAHPPNEGQHSPSG